MAQTMARHLRCTASKFLLPRYAFETNILAVSGLILLILHQRAASLFVALINVKCKIAFAAMQAMTGL